MEHDEMDVSRWVDERLAALAPPDNYRPDSSAAFARFQRRAAPAIQRWWLWAGVSAAAVAACAVVLVTTAPPACANPLGCASTAKPGPPAPTGAAALAPAAYKQSGSPDAPITCELFTDYECPHCALFALETMPRFTAKYIVNGKVRLVHRDFPLPRHRYARLAALYADAAGEAGYYQAVARKLYRTQEVWSADGDVDGQVAQAVPPPVMRKVRDLVRGDPAVQKSVAADEARAGEKRIDRTPTLLCNGQAIGPNLAFPQVEASLDAMLAQR